jgi:hypothetical protein
MKNILLLALFNKCNDSNIPPTRLVIENISTRFMIENIPPTRLMIENIPPTRLMIESKV